MLYTAINIILAVLFFYLFVSNFYFFVFGLAYALSSKKRTPIDAGKKHRIAVFIPSYKEDEVIVHVAKKALEQNYDSNHFRVAVIADSLQDETLEKLYALPIETVVVSFEKSTKSKALRAGMAKLGNKYDIAVVLDADNIMAPDFLDKINTAFADGYQVVQGHRVAKNVDSNFAVLDAASEEINNSIFRKGHRVLGLPSALIGSGMAFNYQLFRDFMANVNAVGGFDKELELRLTREKVAIEYLEDALVYDEKISEKGAFENQRKRWLSAQLVYFQRFFLKALGQLLSKANLGFFDKAIQMILPPRVMSLGLSLLLWAAAAINFLFFQEQLSLSFASFLWWHINLACIVLALSLALPVRMYNNQLLKAALSLPSAILSMFAILFKLKGANKKFIHTKHKHVDQELPKL